MTTQADPLREALIALYDEHHGLNCGAENDAPSWGRGAHAGWDAAVKRVLNMLPALAQSPAPQGEARDPRVERMAKHCCVPELDEPFFVLLGRDPQAPGLVEKWAQDRAKVEPGDKAVSAYATAKFMRMWKDAHPERGLSMQEFAMIATPQGEGMREALEKIASHPHRDGESRSIARAALSATPIPSDRAGREEEIAWQCVEEIVRQNHKPPFCLADSTVAVFDMDSAVRTIATALRQSASAGIERAAREPGFWRDFQRDGIERAAKVIYDLYPYDGVGQKPEWVLGGNALKQGEARRTARLIVEAYTAPSRRVLPVSERERMERVKEIKAKIAELEADQAAEAQWGAAVGAREEWLKELRAERDRLLQSSGGETGEVAKWMMERSYATGHGDTVADMLGELEAQAKERASIPAEPNPPGSVEPYGYTIEGNTIPGDWTMICAYPKGRHHHPLYAAPLPSASEGAMRPGLIAAAEHLDASADQIKDQAGKLLAVGTDECKEQAAELAIIEPCLRAEANYLRARATATEFEVLDDHHHSR